MGETQFLLLPVSLSSAPHQTSLDKLSTSDIMQFEVEHKITKKKDLFWVKTTKQGKAGGQDEIAKGKVTIITQVIRSSTVQHCRLSIC